MGNNRIKFNPAGLLFVKLFLLGFIVISLLFCPFHVLGDAESRNTNLYQENIPLLLGSGLSDCQTAYARYILWTEEMGEVDNLLKRLEETGLLWKKEILQDTYGRQACKLSAGVIVEKSQEKDLVPKTLNKLGQIIKDSDVKIYFEERIEQEINLEDYFRAVEARTLQSYSTTNLKSLSGYFDGYSQCVQAGEDLINIQILGKKTKENTDFSDSGKTVLALPALLEEF